MIATVKELIDHVCSVDCQDALIAIVANDKKRSTNFHLSEIMKLMTKKVFLSISTLS